MDLFPECDDDPANYYQNLIVTLIWVVELGWIEISVQVSAMSRHRLDLGMGQLEKLLHIFSYIKSHERSKFVYDPNAPRKGG